VIVDANDIPSGSTLETDICVIGAGAASISLARRLSGSEVRVCVLESGGLDYERQTQNLYKGANIGLEYEPLDLCRVRGFGGSTGPKGWGGWSKPLSEIDFEERSWVPLSGWPLELDALRPYYSDARVVLGFPATSDPSGPNAAGVDGTLPVDGTRLRNETCPLSPAPNLGATRREELRSASNVQVVLHANVTEIVSDRIGGTVTGVRARTLGGKTLSVTARYVVLAAGGVENPRLLLESDRQQGLELGNSSDFVGRCFMEHPRFAWGRLDGRDLAEALWRYDPGVVVPQRDKLNGRFDPRVFGTGLAIKPDVQRREEVLNARTWIMPIAKHGETEGGQEIKELVFWLKKKRLPGDVRTRLLRIVRDFGNAGMTVAAHFLGKLNAPSTYQFVTVMEQAPNRSSRVTLGPERDALGQHRARLDWHLTDLEYHTLDRKKALILEDLSALGFKCWPETRRRSREPETPKPRWVWHHIGTTRMSQNPASGVVDPDCRVHGVRNLYVAGSSVFPTSGNDMPTLTVIALACRLADHLKQKVVNEKDLARAEPTSGRASRPSVAVA
jgi:choline dehydrogenase-like flavoprotein